MSGSVKRAYIENQIAEFARVLPGIIPEVTDEQVKNMKFLIEHILYEGWGLANDLQESKHI